MRFLIILLLTFRTVSNDHVMFEVYGKPNSLNDAQTINNTEWSVCMSKCYSSENCILAHNQNETCYMFNEVTMGTVTRTNPKDKSVVAFKANSTNGQCSTGPPSNMSGTIFFKGNSDLITMWVNYDIYTNGSSWQIKYDYNFSCPENFDPLVRNNRTTRYHLISSCVMEYYSLNGTALSYDYSRSYCESQGATLNGVAYYSDWWYTLSKLTNNKKLYGRIDGIRTKTCQSTPKTKECMSVKGFEFTDKSVTNFDRHYWVTDSSARARNGDDCLVIFSDDNNAIKMDVRSCTTDSPRKAQLVFCSINSYQSFSEIRNIKND
ncbi:unnamed protein product [Caenorhabditis nigoni]